MRYVHSTSWYYSGRYPVDRRLQQYTRKLSLAVIPPHLLGVADDSKYPLPRVRLTYLQGEFDADPRFPDWRAYVDGEGSDFARRSLRRPKGELQPNLKGSVLFRDRRRAAREKLSTLARGRARLARARPTARALRRMRVLACVLSRSIRRVGEPTRLPPRGGGPAARISLVRSPFSRLSSVSKRCIAGIASGTFRTRTSISKPLESASRAHNRTESQRIRVIS